MEIKKNVGVISLGCDKNRVDTEKMLFEISKQHNIVADIEYADIVVINTCAFLSSSREEAIDTILETATLKGNGSLEKIIVTGCLPQMFVNDIFEELIEVDAFLGTDDYGEILSVIDEIYNGERVNKVKQGKPIDSVDRVVTTDTYAYLKIAEGCSNFCTYCLIPAIRGSFHSIQKAKLISEVEKLGKIKELILVAQDLTNYGKDLENESLVTLIKSISKLPNVESIRLLYCYPEGVTDELIEELATNDKVIKYIDIPFQHADDTVLKRMNRKGSFESNLKLVEKLKTKVPDIAIRSTFITGFPGETEEAFARLKEFLEKAKLLNAGFFAYSREEGTPAYKLPNQIDEKIKIKRQKELYKVQKKIAKELLANYKNKTLDVIADAFNGCTYEGRAYFNAPQIDGKVYFFSQKPITLGKTYKIKINSIKEYDLYGEVVD